MTDTIEARTGRKMKQSKKDEKVSFLKAIGWHEIEWTKICSILARDGQTCRVDRYGKVRFLRQGEWK